MVSLQMSWPCLCHETEPLLVQNLQVSHFGLSQGKHWQVLDLDVGCASRCLVCGTLEVPRPTVKIASI